MHDIQKQWFYYFHKNPKEHKRFIREFHGGFKVVLEIGRDFNLRFVSKPVKSLARSDQKTQPQDVLLCDFNVEILVTIYDNFGDLVYLSCLNSCRIRLTSRFEI